MEAHLARDGLIEALHKSRAEELDELNRAHRPDRHLSLLGAWAGSWMRPMERAATEAAPAIGPGELGVTFVGHASALLRWPKLSVALTPMLGRRLGACRRATEPGVGADELAACDLVLITHAEPEFLHRPTLRRVPTRATIVVPPRCAARVSDLGFARVVE